MSEWVARPTKEQVRRWLTQRMQTCEPLPDIEQIQRIVGWKPSQEEYAASSKSEQHVENTVLECLADV